MNYKILIYLLVTFLLFSCEKEEEDKEQYLSLPGKITFVSSGGIAVTTVEDADFWSYNRVTDNGHAEYKHPVWINNSDKIVFISDYKCHVHPYPKVAEGLYIVDSLGTEIIELVTLDEDINAQCCSQDGNTIFFSSEQTLYSIHIDGTALDSIYTFNSGIGHLDCLNNNTLLFQKDNKLCSFDIKTKELAVINSEFDGYGDAHYSPDGESIVFSCNDNIYTINSEGNNAKKLTDYTTRGVFFTGACAWSPSGNYIIYYFSNESAEKYSYSVIDKNGILQDKIVEANGFIWNKTFDWTE